MKTINFPDDCLLISDMTLRHHGTKQKGKGCVKLHKYVHCVFKEAGTLHHDIDDPFATALENDKHYDKDHTKDSDRVVKISDPVIFTFYRDLPKSIYVFFLTPKKETDCDEDDPEPKHGRP